MNAAPQPVPEYYPQKSQDNGGSNQPVVYPSTWGYDIDDVSNLQPNHNGHLYYTQKGESSKFLFKHHSLVFVSLTVI